MKISCNGYVLMAFIFGNIFHKSFVKHVVAHENAAGNEQFFQIRVKFGVLPLRPVHKNEVVAPRQHRNYFAGIAFKRFTRAETPYLRKFSRAASAESASFSIVLSVARGAAFSIRIPLKPIAVPISRIFGAVSYGRGRREAAPFR